VNWPESLGDPPQEWVAYLNAIGRHSWTDQNNLYIDVAHTNALLDVLVERLTAGQALKDERDGLKLALEEACRALIDAYHDRLKLEAQLKVLRDVREVEP